MMTPKRWTQLQRLFDEVVDLDMEARTRRLDRLRKDDSDLCRRVEALLVAHERADEVLYPLDQPEGTTTTSQGGLDPHHLIDTHLAHYRIIAYLGGGGMGVVYKAQDLRLKRMVALKFLPPALTRDPEAKTRFIHEAQAASALDHPNICTIHEIHEHEEGYLFIVMALVEGETLTQKLARRPLPLPEAIAIADQVARGLAQAHAQHIVHRDVKPANVMVVDSGQVKLVDFGLAKVAEVNLTQTGVTLGTIAYMSPEQLQGKAVDHRTDIWALGVLLYEMVTGQRPFSGTRSEGVAHAILHEEPEPLTALRSRVPMALERIVEKALAKDPDDRYQHMDEIPVDLRALTLRGMEASTVSTRMGMAWLQQRKAILVGTLAGLLVLAAGVLLWPLVGPTRNADTVPVQFSITLPAGQELTTWYQPVALSPDGRQVVYSAQDEDTTRLYRRTLNRLDPVAVPGTEGARDPFFSPDGQWIGFVAGGKLQKVQTAGGIPQPICDAPQGIWGASWSPNDTIYVSLGLTAGLSKVPATGGIPEVLTTPNTGAGEVGHYWPQYLPNGRGLLFTIWSGTGWQIAILPPGPSTRLLLSEEGAAAHYLPTGHLVYAQMAGALATPALVVVPFNLSRYQITGTPISVLEYPGLNGPNFAVSSTGTLVYVASGSVWASLRQNRPVWVDRTGNVTPFIDQNGRFGVPRFSPDGTRLIIANFSEGGSYDIWMYDVERGRPTRLTEQGAINNFPLWTPDGERITFTTARTPPGLYWKAASREGEAEQLLPRQQHIKSPGSWTPDGKTLAFTENNLGAHSDIGVFSLEDGNAAPLLATSANETAPRFSPNGRYIAYASDASGQHEVYVRSYPDPDTTLQISDAGGSEPVWAPDGETLYYRQDDTMMATVITTGSRLSAQQPRPLFEGRFEKGEFAQPNYDVTRDGRFLMIQTSKTTAPTQLHVVLDWFAELEARVPTQQ